jgi:phosphonate transport system substrate-binding protein
MRAFIHAVLLVTLYGVEAAAGAVATLGFGVVPTESAVGLRRDYEVLRADLESALGQPVKMVFAPDYTGVIEAMRFGQIHLGVFGNNAAIDAVDRAGGEVFSQQIDKDGNPGYWSVILVHRDSPIDTLDLLIARRSELTFAMGDPQSTSGTLVPGTYAFAKHGVNPAREFKASRRSHHEANVLSVANRQIDACTANNETLFRLEQRMPAMARQVKVIWKSPLIAMDALILKRDLPAETQARLRSFFAHYGDTPEQRTAIAALKLSGFRTSSNDQLIPYRLMRLQRERTLIEADDRLTADSRTEKLAAVATAMAALESGGGTFLAPPGAP